MRFLISGARNKMANATNTKAMAQLRIQTIIKFGFNPRFTKTITPLTKKVAIKLMVTANFTSKRDGF